jgi:hypothetical protein
VSHKAKQQLSGSLTSTHFRNSRRFSSITISPATSVTIAKSTPSISSDLINETNHELDKLSLTDTTRPFSFQILDPRPFDQNNRYKSLAHLPTTCPPVQPSWCSPAPLIPIVCKPKPKPVLTGLLQNGSPLSLADPSTIRPVISHNYISPPADALRSEHFSYSPSSIEKQTSAFEDYPSTFGIDYIKFHERSVKPLERKPQADFLSLSLSPPINRKHNSIGSVSL